VPPGGASAPTSAWQPGHYISAALQVPVQAKLAAGSYWLAIGLYDPRTGARRPLRAPPQPRAPADGENALLLGPLTIK
jgi:hypothetical protein